MHIVEVQVQVMESFVVESYLQCFAAVCSAVHAFLVALSLSKTVTRYTDGNCNVAKSRHLGTTIHSR